MYIYIYPHKHADTYNHVHTQAYELTLVHPAPYMDLCTVYDM